MKRRRIWPIIFSGILGIQIILIVVFNFTRIKYVGGFDSSAAMAQAMEIWNQKTIFLKDWSYQSTLGLDSVLIPASLMYGITHNIYLAYALADTLALALYVFIFRDILKRLNIGKIYRIFAIIILLTPYSLEPLGYMPMMFTNAAYYTVKVLIPVMLIDVVMRIYQKESLKKCIPLLIILGVSLYLTGFSCGLYLFICGLLPLFVYEIIVVIKEGQLKKILNPYMFVLLIGTILFGAGYISSKLYGAQTFTNGMMLTSVYNFTDNFFKCFVGMAELFGAIPYRDVAVTSVYGINYLAHLAALIIFIYLIVYAVRSTCKKKAWNDLRGRVAGMCLSVIAINILVLILTDTTYGSETFEFRYHIIPMVSGVVLAAVGLSDFVETLRGKNNTLAVNVVLAVTAVVWMMCNCTFAYYYSINNTYYETGCAITNVVESNTDCKRLYFVGDDDVTIEVARLARLNPDLIVNDGFTFGEYTGWGISTAHFDRLEDMREMVVVCKKEAYDEIETTIKNRMKSIGSVDEYLIFKY